MECVIISYASAEDIRGFAEDLAPGTFSRVLVVDNASPDDSVQVARSHGFDVLARTSNDGFGAAANEGIRQTSGELVTLLNPDVHVRDASLIPTLARHFEDERIGLAAPALMLPRGAAQDSAREIPTPRQLLQRRRTGRDIGALRPERAQEVPWVVGAFMMIRRSAFEQVGGFDPRYFLYFEDVDLCTRMRIGGWKVRYDPEQLAYHQHRAASRVGFARRPMRLHIRSAARFYGRHPRAIAGSDPARRFKDPTPTLRVRSGSASPDGDSHGVTSDSPLRVALVISFQNEAEHLPRLLASLDAQTEPADQVILVDDGSTDQSNALAGEFARRHADTAQVVSRERRPAVSDRLADAPELSAFVSGVAALAEPWDVVAKIDGDLALSDTLVADVRHRFRDDPGLGITGSYLAVEEGGTRRREQHPAEHVRGPNKFYRRSCYEQITPLPTQLGWDTFDDLRARAAGWRTMSFAATGGDTLHLRPTGAHDGRLRAYRRWGLCAWAYGAHPLAVVLGAMRRSTRAPYALAGIHYLWGWCRGWAQGYPRIESETRAFGRAEDLRRIRSEFQRVIGVR
jgi:N-acetylglucosaminyl-diphospho-decaprenol L-rhamnosyltransferase